MRNDFGVFDHEDVDERWFGMSLRNAKSVFVFPKKGGMYVGPYRKAHDKPAHRAATCVFA